MDVRCPACGARYTADDEKLRGKTARMRCKACNTAWLVSGPGAGPAVGAVISTPPPATFVAASVPPPAQDDDEDRRAAIVKRGSEREKRDLFAQREVELGGVKSVPPPSFGFTAGARNEDSVLFRVDELSTTARTRTMVPPPATASSPAPATQRIPSPQESANSLSNSDEGVIDLRALSNAPPALRPVALPVAPLFSEPPPVTMEVHGRQGGATNKLALFGGIAAAAMMLLGIGAGVAYAFKGVEPVRPEAAASAAPPPVETAPAPKAPEPAPAATTAAQSDDAKDATDAKETKGKRGKKGRGRGKGVITNKTPPPAPRTVKAADPCGCHGDFQCVLACTAKRGK